jgi:hypothetical protein
VEGHTAGRASKPLTELFADRRLLTSTILAITFASISLLGTWGAVQKIPRGSEARLPGQTAHAQGNVQMAMGIGAIFGCLIAPMIAAWLNRRVAYFLLSLGSLIACQVLFRYFTEYNMAFLAMAFLVGGVPRRLRLVAAVPARTIPHARPRDGARHQL